MRIVITVMVCGLLSGCAASYATPGRGARMQMFGATAAEQAEGTDASIQKALDKKPLASFPAAVAVARVQAAGYTSRTASGWGTGQYSVVTSRDIESTADVERLGKLHLVRGVAPLNRLVIPATLQTDYELRHAAAKMHADVLLIYTLDTTFQNLDRTTPLSSSIARPSSWPLASISTRWPCSTPSPRTASMLLASTGCPCRVRLRTLTEARNRAAVRTKSAAGRAWSPEGSSTASSTRFT